MHRQGLLRRPGTFALACAIAAAAFAGEASAGPTPAYDDQGGTINAGTAGEIALGCASSQDKVVGGGVFLSGTGVDVEVRSTAPHDGADRDKVPDDGWVGAGHSGAASQTLTTYVACAPGRFKYASARKEIGVGLWGSATAKCPKGWTAISGGVKGPNTALVPSTGIALVSTRPITNAGLLTRKWSGRYDNGSTAKIKIKTWAICSKRSSQYNTRFTGFPEFPSGTQLGLTSYPEDACGLDGPYHVTGLGAGAAGAPDHTEVASVKPIDQDADTIPDDGVTAYANNETGSQQQMQIWHVCTEF